MVNREQLTFASAGFDVYRRPMRRAKFLREMNQAMPWQALMALIEPFYPKEGQPGRPVTPLIWMIKLYFLQIWFSLSDPQTEEAMHDSWAVQEFLGLALGRDRPPDETTILRKKESTRCRVEHVFGLITHVFGWRKVRFRGIDKNLQYAFGVAAAVNAYLHRRALLRKMAGRSPG